jgi:hypothetical protein
MKQATPYRLMIGVGVVLLLASAYSLLLTGKSILCTYDLLGEPNAQIEELAPVMSQALFAKLAMIITLPVGVALVIFSSGRLRRIKKQPPEIPNRTAGD